MWARATRRVDKTGVPIPVSVASVSDVLARHHVVGGGDGATLAVLRAFLAALVGEVPEGGGSDCDTCWREDEYFLIGGRALGLLMAELASDDAGGGAPAVLSLLPGAAEAVHALALSSTMPPVAPEPEPVAPAAASVELSWVGAVDAGWDVRNPDDPCPLCVVPVPQGEDAGDAVHKGGDTNPTGAELSELRVGMSCDGKHWMCGACWAISLGYGDNRCILCRHATALLRVWVPLPDGKRRLVEAQQPDADPDQHPITALTGYGLDGWVDEGCCRVRWEGCGPADDVWFGDGQLAAPQSAADDQTALPAAATRATCLRAAKRRARLLAAVHGEVVRWPGGVLAVIPEPPDGQSPA